MNIACWPAFICFSDLNPSFCGIRWQTDWLEFHGAIRLTVADKKVPVGNHWVQKRQLSADQQCSQPVGTFAATI
jgi:hypothetical protein